MSKWSEPQGWSIAAMYSGLYAWTVGGVGHWFAFAALLLVAIISIMTVLADGRGKPSPW